jgi:LuxR family transcriptional regulator, maltose regulon positive regulatory protein
VVAPALTDAELRVLALLATHRTQPQIAVELFVAQSTVRSQVTSIYRKLGARSRDEAVRRARELGLL